MSRLSSSTKPIIFGKLSRQQGSALVELSLVFPLLLIVLFGAVELGRYVYVAYQVDTAAEAAAQYGSQSHFYATDIVGMKNAAAVSAPELSGLTTSVSPSCVCSDGSASTCLSTDCTSSGHIQEILSVKTTASYQPLIKWPGVPSSFSLTSGAVRKVLN